jgi:2-(1,2-epoxy-1,2-dihydrophenyl)acetyl-CoA isomerase
MKGTVETKLENGILTLTLSNPEVKNALGHTMARALHERLTEAAIDQEVRSIVLTGAGDAFCVGADVRDIGVAQDDDPLAVRFAKQERWNSVEMRGRRITESAQRFALLHTIGKPTIAVLNGPAAGAGMSLALACDFRLAADDAMLTTAFAKLGASGDLGMGYYLVRLVGLQKARELLYFSDRVGAADALAMGLVDRVFPAAELRSAAQQFAQRLADGPPIAYHYIKRNLELAQTATLHEYLVAESQHQVRCFSTQDHREAAEAFRHKRKPVFHGR